mgnify:CR=1 FL=1
MFTTDKIAILMATYNGEKYIEQQINSIFQQSYSNWILYIHDDGSTDDTVNIIQKYAIQYPTKIFIINGDATGGARNNFFYMMQSVEAPYVMFCDQDDIWLKSKIEITYNKMLSIEENFGNDTPILVFSDLKVVDKDLNVIAEKMSEYQKLNPNKIQFKDILIQNITTGCTMMLNKACVQKVLLLHNLENIIMHDWWCAMVTSYFGKLVYIDDPLVLYRQHNSNSVGAKAVTDIKYIMHKFFNSDEIRKSLELTRKQTSEFIRVYGLKDKCLASEYIDNANKNKIQRLIFYIKNNVWKSGFLRNLGLILWG